ncbi:competence protein ComK [Bacillus sp. FJAT-27251]|uniref:competence protein ComK n=1 Tax=Bacillus sp. FJAT-27251 TaxID=1684142 RepID=UPI000840D239|nr:competence protein ComK [Bacillus sp. FJAT-27251]
MNREHNHMDEYEINPLTMIIFPFLYGSRVFSKVVEMEDEYISPLKPLDLVKRGCEYNLSDYEARKKATRTLTGITHKIPIAIDPFSSVYFLPTISPTKTGCIWVSHEHVLDHRRHDPHSTRVIFRNKKAFILPVSYSSFEKQLLRTSLLRTRTLQRMKENERRASYLISGRKAQEERQPVLINERYLFDQNE